MTGIYQKRYSTSKDKEEIPARWGQTREARGTTTLQPTEQKWQSQKVRQNETTKEYVPDKRTR